MCQLSWVWMASATTKRTSLHFGIMGDESIAAVSSGNTIAARVALLIMVAVVRGVYWCDLWLRTSMEPFLVYFLICSSPLKDLFYRELSW